jgi:hypothetical protein
MSGQLLLITIKEIEIVFIEQSPNTGCTVQYCDKYGSCGCDIAFDTLHEEPGSILVLK